MGVNMGPKWPKIRFFKIDPKLGSDGRKSVFWPLGGQNGPVLPPHTPATGWWIWPFWTHYDTPDLPVLLLTTPHTTLSGAGF